MHSDPPCDPFPRPRQLGGRRMHSHATQPRSGGPCGPSRHPRCCPRTLSRPAPRSSVAAVAAPVVMIGGIQPAVTHLRTDAQAGNVADRQQGCEVMSNKHACRRRHATGKGTRLRCYRWPQMAWLSMHSTHGGQDIELRQWPRFLAGVRFRFRRPFRCFPDCSCTGPRLRYNSQPSIRCEA